MYYYRSEDSIEEIDTLKIKRLKEIEASMKVLPVRNISIHPDENICLASKVLLMNSLHRLPLVDGSSDGGDIIVAVITQYKILKFIAANVKLFNCFFSFFEISFFSVKLHALTMKLHGTLELARIRALLLSNILHL